MRIKSRYTVEGVRDTVAVYRNDHAELHAVEASARLATSVTLDRRLDGMNEFREQLNQQAGTFVSRDVLDAIMAGIAEQVTQNARAMQARVDRLEDSGRAAANRVGWYAVALGLTSVILAVVLLLVLARQK